MCGFKLAIGITELEIDSGVLNLIIVHVRFYQTLLFINTVLEFDLQVSPPPPPMELEPSLYSTCLYIQPKICI